MPGITIGEIGNKLGMNTVNNGFLGFDNVRVPLKVIFGLFLKDFKIKDHYFK